MRRLRLDCRTFFDILADYKIEFVAIVMVAILGLIAFNYGDAIINGLLYSNLGCSFFGKDCGPPTTIFGKCKRSTTWRYRSWRKYPYYGIAVGNMESTDLVGEHLFKSR